MTGAAFEYTTLKQAITKPSPLRDYLQATFPNRKAIAAAYKQSAGPIVAPDQGVNPATIGTAFDNMVRLTLEPDELPFPSSMGATKLLGGQGIQVLIDLAELGSADPAAFARTVWVFALFTEAYRYGMPPESLIEALSAENASYDTLLALASDRAVEDLVRLHGIAEQSFYPLLTGPLVVGPAFDRLRIAADGDLIHDGTLIEIKTTLGSKNSKGERYAALDPTTLNQLLAYTLIDTNNEHGISALGIYSARYGHYVRWDLAGLLEELAQRPVDLNAERLRVRDLIGRED